MIHKSKSFSKGNLFLGNLNLKDKEDKNGISFLKKHKIEPVICPIRHRYFWDGGLHCFTLDLRRKGQKEKYFA